MLPRVYNNYTNDSFSSLGFTNRKTNFFYIPKPKSLKPVEKIKIITGAAIGTALPIAGMLKKQKVPVHKLKYSIKDMVLLSTGSISGGLAGGIIVDKGKNTRKKIKEGIFQFFNAVIPTLMIKPLLFVCEKSKFLNKGKVKAAMLLGGIFTGMLAGAQISNKINHTTTQNKRKVKFVDSIANIDVISGALVMAKIPFVNKLGMEKFLPLPYIWTGFESGRTRE